jgi:hypothetical protein
VSTQDLHDSLNTAVHEQELLQAQVQQLEDQVKVLEASTAQAVAARTAAYVQTYRDTKVIDNFVIASRAALATAEI